MITSAVLNAQGGKKHGGAFVPSEFFDLSLFLKRDVPAEVRQAPQETITSAWDNWAITAREAELKKTANRRLG